MHVELQLLIKNIPKTLYIVLLDFPDPRHLGAYFHRSNNSYFTRFCLRKVSRLFLSKNRPNSNGKSLEAVIIFNKCKILTSVAPFTNFSWTHSSDVSFLSRLYSSLTSVDGPHLDSCKKAPSMTASSKRSCC